MKEDIKKKFLDILFDPDPEDSQNSIFNDVNNVENKKEENLSNLKASDILYHKSEKSNIFVDLEEKPNKVNYVSEDNKNEEYEFNSQISPMFGVIETNDGIKLPIEKTIIEKSTKKPLDDHLEIIPSPIYGYGKQDDIKEEDYKPMSDTQELNTLFNQENDEEYSADDSDEIDLEKEITLFDIFGDK